MQTNQNSSQELPKVSIICITYNHEPYIRQALEGFLMQKTDFRYEIIIHDDASPDCTASIIKEYAEQYPQIIKPIYQEENQYSKGERPIFNLFQMVQGEYIALCEGDDYWTDPNKLQMQVDILDADATLSGCGHNVDVVDESGMKYPDEIYRRFVEAKEDVIKGRKDIQKCRFAHTATIVFRSCIYTQMSESQQSEYKAVLRGNTGDEMMSAMLAVHGDFYHMNCKMACYRWVPTHGTSWNARMKGTNRNYEVVHYYLQRQDFFKKEYGVELYTKERLSQIKTQCLCAAYVERMKNPTDLNKDILRKLLALNKWNLLHVIQFKIKYRVTQSEEYQTAPLLEGIFYLYRRKIYSKKMKKLLESSIQGKKIYIYGAGHYGQLMEEVLDKCYDVQIESYIVTKQESNMAYIQRTPVIGIEQLQLTGDQYLIIGAMHKKHKKDICTILNQYGYGNVLWMHHVDIALLQQSC